MLVCVEVIDFILAEYQFRLIKRLFESLLISKLFSSSNLKWMAFSISVICFILLLLCSRYFLSQVFFICGSSAIVWM